MREDQVRVTVSVRVPPAVAFAVFTEQTDSWWLRGPASASAGARPAPCGSKAARAGG